MRPTLAKRAAEIARMDGRNGTNKADWTQAQEELQGITTSFPPESSEAVASIHDWNDPGSVGHRGHKNPLEDEYPAVESLINEGLEEADGISDWKPSVRRMNRELEGPSRAS